MKKPVVGDYFIITCLIKVDPKFQDIIIENLNVLLKTLQEKPYSELNEPEDTKHLIEYYYGPFYIFGQYDIMFLYAIDNLAKGSRLFCTIIDAINQNYNNAIYEFHQLIGMEWNFGEAELPYIADNNTKYKCIGYSLFKYKYPYNRKEDPDWLIEVVKKKIESLIKSEFNDCVHFKIFGSLSWYEAIVLFFGKNNFDILKIGQKLKGFTTFNDCLTTFVKDDAFKGDHTIKSEEVRLNLQLFSHEALNIDTVHKICQKHDLKNYRILKSTSNLEISINTNQIKSCSTLLSDICDQENLVYTKSNISKVELPKEVEYKFENEREIKITINSDLYKEVYEKLSELKSKSLAERKLHALRTKIECLINRPYYKYIFPKNILDALKLLTDKRYFTDDKDILQYYISEINSAISERLAGSQLDTLTGKDMSFLENSASYQRLLLAVEALLQRCLLIYIDRNKEIKLKLEHKKKPVLFVFFDHGPRLIPGIPKKVINSGIQENIPIALRLKMLKYRPWLWISGLREMAKIVWIVEKQSIYNNGNTDREIEEDYINNFIASFLTDDNYCRLCFNEVYKGEKDNLWDQDANELYEIKEISDFDLRNLIDENEVSKYQNKLRQGIPEFELDNDEDFINYINAYYGLEIEEQKLPKPFVSFTLSLYWIHKELREEENV